MTKRIFRARSFLFLSALTNILINYLSEIRGRNEERIVDLFVNSLSIRVLCLPL